MRKTFLCLIAALLFVWVGYRQVCRGVHWAPTVELADGRRRERSLFLRRGGHH